MLKEARGKRDEGRERGWRRGNCAELIFNLAAALKSGAQMFPLSLSLLFFAFSFFHSWTNFIRLSNFPTYVVHQGTSAPLPSSCGTGESLMSFPANWVAVWGVRECGREGGSRTWTDGRKARKKALPSHASNYGTALKNNLNFETIYCSVSGLGALKGPRGDLGGSWCAEQVLAWGIPLSGPARRPCCGDKSN